MFKKLLIPVASLFTLTAFADVPGYYAGFQAGYSYNQKTSATATINSQAIAMSQNKKSGIAGRIFVGYAVTPFYAMEVGLTRFNSASWHTSVASQTVPDTHLAMDAADITTRFSWIARPNYSLYTGFGLTEVRASYGSYSSAFQLNKSHYFLRPKIGIGADYNVSQTLQLNASYTHIFGRGHLRSALNAQNSKDYLPTIGMMALGLVYNF